MVSFSCDACQNVFTKPKVERHLYNCPTSTVSCIDCGTVFDRHTIRAHTSCITEAEKYGPRRTKSDSTFCVTCYLQLNGAVHAEQHYNSKKHRANIRKAKRKILTSAEAGTNSKVQPEGKALPKVDGNEPDATEPFGILPDEVNGREGSTRKKTKTSSHREVRKAADGADCEKDPHRTNQSPARKIRGLKRAIKKALKRAPKQTLRTKALVKQISAVFGKEDPQNLERLVEEKVRFSRRFTAKRGKISLTANSS
ncbi:hypothetical protein BWQ96_06549 [Gracilariopsis chorda]|uniref:U1-type domain-containing protein n=1 Tax=Gracilariopsis chorda TaxID=448386 RepID=A0A2V3INU0_9FLOR|nr:hypothetical protein BWQ96_06549 [Gracilariopsis chorda]|eukprot:PXF43719.1 hypothetical protein BWQ96_06549 [Gracilariopsis chorda]